MYIDIKKYRLNNPAMKVWFNRDQNNRINLVIMKYHTSISLHMEGDTVSLSEISRIIHEYNPASITGKKSIIEKIAPSVCLEYNTEYGHIFEYKKFCDFGGNEMVEKATEEDAMEIARLITSDKEIGSYYEIEDFANQLVERMRADMGRNYIIREDGKIIGHIATYAELDDVAVTGGLIVERAYEGHMFGAVLEGYVVRQMREEGFRLYTFVVNHKRYKLLKNMGNLPVGEYGKMIKAGE